jgi:hypothetical protein|eukprot:COSAG02_NODE_34_length_49821_cov_105.420438_34_plen_49_part_00
MPEKNGLPACRLSVALFFTLTICLVAAENKIMKTEVAQLFSERLGKME